MREIRFAGPIHYWFGLSYANYLTVPRSVLQSMPEDWQAKMVELLEEMNEACEAHGVPQTHATVFVRDQRGRFVEDPLADYQRGRRNVFQEIWRT